MAPRKATGVGSETFARAASDRALDGLSCSRPAVSSATRLSSVRIAHRASSRLYSGYGRQRSVAQSAESSLSRRRARVVNRQRQQARGCPAQYRYAVTADRLRASSQCSEPRQFVRRRQLRAAPTGEAGHQRGTREDLPLDALRGHGIDWPLQRWRHPLDRNALDSLLQPHHAGRGPGGYDDLRGLRERRRLLDRRRLRG